VCRPSNNSRSHRDVRWHPVRERYHVGKAWNIIVLARESHTRPRQLQGAIIQYIIIYSNTVGKAWNTIVLGNRTPRPQQLQGAIIKNINIYSNSRSVSHRHQNPAFLCPSLPNCIIHLLTSPHAAYAREAPWHYSWLWQEWTRL
jgi:hypothetical protein